LIASGKIFSDLGLPPLDPARDRVMLCGSPQMLKDTKALLEELKQPNAPKDDFFESLQAGSGKVDAEVEIFNEDEDDMLTKRLKYQILEKKGKLFYNIAEHFTSGEMQTVFLKGHKKAITAMEWS